MKIALIVPGGVDRSGEVRVIPALLGLIRRLATGHELHVFATHQEREPATWQLEGAQIHNLGLPRTALRAAKMIWDEHRRAPFHIVQSMWSGACGMLAVAMARVLRAPSVVHIAGGELASLPELEYGGCRSFRGRMRESLVLRLANRVTCASRPIVELAAARGIKALRLPLGVDLQRWPPRCPVARREGEVLRLVHIASLNRVKDQPTLLQALRLIAERGHQFHLDVVGEDTLGGTVQEMAAQLGVAQRTAFHGFLRHSQLRPLVERAHVCLISSRHEAGPLVVLEAGAVGVPTVGTAVGHIKEWTPHAALAVPCNDFRSLAASIESVSRDEDLRLRLGGAAHARALNEDADQTAHGFNQIYRDLAGPS